MSRWGRPLNGTTLSFYYKNVPFNGRPSRDISYFHVSYIYVNYISTLYFLFRFCLFRPLLQVSSLLQVLLKFDLTFYYIYRIGYATISVFLPKYSISIFDTFSKSCCIAILYSSSVSFFNFAAVILILSPLSKCAA